MDIVTFWLFSFFLFGCVLFVFAILICSSLRMSFSYFNDVFPPKNITKMTKTKTLDVDRLKKQKYDNPVTWNWHFTDI